MSKRGRVRTRGGVGQSPPLILNYTPPGGPTATFPVKCDVGVLSNKYESITDVVGNLQGDYNPCDHFKLLSRLTPVENFTVGDAPFHSTYSFVGGGLNGSLLAQACLDLELLPDQYLDDFSASAEDHFRTTVQDTNSIINLLLELIGVCSLNLKSIKSLSERYLKAIKIYQGMIRKGLSHWVAWNFALKPLIRDIVSLIELNKRAQKRIKWLKKWNGRPVKVRYRQSPVAVSSDFVGFSSPWVQWNGDDVLDPIMPPAPQDHQFEFKYSGEVVVTSWAHIIFHIPDWVLDDWVSCMGMCMLTMQGVYNPAKIAWEAIPFSWLIEWFTSKRAQLVKELASLSPFPPAEILSVGHSVRVKLTGETRWIQGENTVIETGPFQFTRYTRQPGLPTGESSFGVGDLSLTQLSILLGIAANWRRRR